MAKPKRDRSAPSRSREEVREAKRQELERQKRRRNALLIIALVAVVIVAAVILSLTVFFKITVVEVDASQTQYSAEQIRTASGIEEGDNLFLMNREEVSDSIGHQLPYTGEVSVKRSFPSRVKIYVEDSTITAAVKYNDEFIVLNESNKVLAKAGSIDRLNTLVEQQEKKRKTATPSKKTKRETTTSTTSASESTTTSTTTTTTTTTTAANDADIAGGEDLRKATDQVTIITGVKVKEAKVGYPLKAKNAEVFETYKEIRSAMERWGVKEITAVDLTKVTDIKLTYQKRITILLGSASGLDRKAAMCARVLEEQDKVSKEQKGSIDLSIEGKAYFSEGGATTRTTTVTTTTAPTVPEATEVPTEPNGETTTGTLESTTQPVTGDDTTISTTRDMADIGG